MVTLYVKSLPLKDVITNLAEVYTVKGDDDSAKQYFDEARLLATAGKFR